MLGDDGVGSDGQTAGNDKEGLGLLAMREKTSLIWETFQLRSKPTHGTHTRIEIPLPETQGHGQAN